MGKLAGLADNNILRIYCFGSICSDTWGVGSDLDIVIILKKTTVPFISRACLYDTSAISVPVDVLVYTQSEIIKLSKGKSRFTDEIEKSAVLLYQHSNN